MTHPISELAAAAAVVVAVGAATILVLPRAKPEPPAQTIMLEVEGPAVVRAEPLVEKSDAERVDDLQRQLAAIAAEHERLTEEVKAAVEAAPVSSRRGRKGAAP